MFNSDFTEWGKTIVAMHKGLTNAGMDSIEALQIVITMMAIMTPKPKEEIKIDKKILDKMMEDLLGEKGEEK